MGVVRLVGICSERPKSETSRVLPAGILAKAMQLCAEGAGMTGVPAPDPYASIAHAGAGLAQRPYNEADAQTTVRTLLAQAADFEAGPLGTKGKDLTSYRITPASVFDACALVRVQADDPSARMPGSATIASVTALLHRAFGARITDTLRPMNASYGSQHSWHKVGQAIDFVPVGGVGAIDRGQIRSLMAAGGVRLIELLGPSDRGHANHWHIAFARAGLVDQVPASQEDKNWVVNVASAAADSSQPSPHTEAPAASASITQITAAAPPRWEVFAQADWRATHGGGS
jgi:hypothetical protein